MTLSHQRFTDLLASFQSAEPTPGGGSASALGGAVGASLLAMVAGLGKPRVQTSDDTAQLALARVRCAALSDWLAALMDRDSDAYDLVVSAFRSPRGTEAEKAARTRQIQEALRAATEAPLDVMRACAEAIGQATVVAALGNSNASSDIRVGLELLGAGLRGARLNVEVNLASMKDAAFIARVRTEADRLATDAESDQAAALARLESPG